MAARTIEQLLAPIIASDVGKWTFGLFFLYRIISNPRWWSLHAMVVLYCVVSTSPHKWSMTEILEFFLA